MSTFAARDDGPPVMRFCDALLSCACPLASANVAETMHTPDVPAAEATAPARKLSASTASQASRLFILPAIIVGACAFCLLVAGGLYALLQENQDPSKYIEQVVAGAGNRRWQAAYE